MTCPPLEQPIDTDLVQYRSAVSYPVQAKLNWYVEPVVVIVTAVAPKEPSQVGYYTLRSNSNATGVCVEFCLFVFSSPNLEYPSCRQATLASAPSHPVLQIAFQFSLMHISRRPVLFMLALALTILKSQFWQVAVTTTKKGILF